MIYVLAFIGCAIDIFFIAHDYKKKDGLSVVLKTAASLFFVVIAVMITIQKQNDIRAILLTIALAMDLIGDFVLILRNVNNKHKDIIFITGTTFFIIGHFFLQAMLCNINSSFVLKSFVITTIFFFTLGYVILKSLKTKKGILIFGGVYFYIIYYIFFYALFVFMNSPTIFHGIFLFAYFLFALSDVLLSLQKYNPHANKIKYLQVIYRLCYYISQVFLAFSILYIM